MKKLITTLSVFFLLSTAVFSADLAYQSADVASLTGGQPARAARVKNMFDTIKDYINAVSGAWITNSRIIDDTIQGAKLADAAAGNGLEKDGSENLQVKVYSLGALKITSGSLGVAADDICISVSGVSNELNLLDNCISTDKLIDSAVTTDKIEDLAVDVYKIGADAVTADKIKDGEVSTDEIAIGCITTEKLSSEAQGGLIPAGTILTYAGAAAPTGYFSCDGSTVSRTLYPELYLAIGTYYGSGDGSTTFNLPDTRGRFVVGADSVTYGLNTKGGASEVTLTSAQSGLPAHTHASSTDAYNLVKYQTTTGSASMTESGFSSRQVSYSSTAFTVNANAAANAAAAHENLPPFIGLNHIIKY